MQKPHFPTEAVPLATAARWLRVPARWLREEIEAGRLPGLVADRAVLVHVPTIVEMLSDRAKAGEGAIQ
jgi:hypothetical protein